VSTGEDATICAWAKKIDVIITILSFLGYWFWDSSDALCESKS